MIAALIGQGADFASTAAALQNPSLREANPVMSSNLAIQALVKAGYTATAAYQIKHLADSGHPTAAKILGYAIAAAGAIPALSNLHQMASVSR